jgi:hypothetical protein
MIVTVSCLSCLVVEHAPSSGGSIRAAMIYTNDQTCGNLHSAFGGIYLVVVELPPEK